jgi:hypothetical protein
VRFGRRVSALYKDFDDLIDLATNGQVDGTHRVLPFCFLLGLSAICIYRMSYLREPLSAEDATIWAFHLEQSRPETLVLKVQIDIGLGLWEPKRSASGWGPPT